VIGQFLTLKPISD